MINILRKNFDIIRVYNILLLIVSFSLSLNRKVLPIFLILLLVLSIFIRIKFKYYLFKEKYFYFFLIFFLYIIARTLFDIEHIKVGLKFIEKNLSLIVLPLAIIPRFISNYKLIFKYFIYGLIFSLVIMIFRFGLDFLVGNHRNINFFHKKILLYGFHPTYLGLYSIIAIFLLDKIELFNNKLRRLLILFFSFIVFISVSRIAIFSLILFYIYKSIFIKNKFYIKLLLAVFIMGIISYNFSDEYKLKINQLKDFKGFSYYDNNNYGSVSLRVAKIKASIRVWEKNKWFGVGPGQIERQLISFYRTKSIQCWPCAKRKYNSHNEYLQLLASTGIIGLFLFLFLLFFFIYKGIGAKNELLLNLIFLILIFSSTESILERQRGITFLVFMLVMIYNYMKLQNNKLNLK